MNIKDKVILVTGAASGIGRSIVEKGLSLGAILIACDINEEELKRMQIDLSSDKLTIYKVDVSNYNEVKEFFKKIGNLKIDCLVNNAGVYLAKSILDYSDNEFNKVIDINIKGAINFTKFYAESVMKEKRKGSIINISSVSGQEGSSDAIYSLTKAALLGFTKSCAMNFSPYIRVNAIAPGIVDTNMMKSIPNYRISEYRKSELIKEPILPEDVSNTVYFLISDLSRNYSGSTFDINNGCYLR